MTDSEVRIDASARIRSREYRMSSGRFAVEMFYRYAGPWLLALLACALTGIVLGLTVDLRWLVVGLMVIFVVAPMLLAFLYYYFGLRREAYVNTVKHTVETTPEGIVVTLFFGEDTEPREETFGYDEFLPMKMGLKSAMLPLAAPAKGFIWIPVTAYDNDELFIEAVQTIDYRIHVARNLPLPFDVVTAE